MSSVWIVSDRRVESPKPCERALHLAGWRALPDLSSHSTRRQIRTVIDSTYARQKPNVRASHVRELWTFSHRVRTGDLVVVVSSLSELRISLGKVTGGYVYLSGEADRRRRHAIPVVWLQVDVPSAALGDDLRYSLNGQEGIVPPKHNDAARRLRLVAAGGSDPGPRWPKAKTGPPPPRLVLDPGRPTEIDVVMREYEAIRGEIQTSLGNQVSILSFGTATAGLLVAAAAALWKDQALLTGLILALGVPLACFLTLAVYGGELVRLMRAGLFMNFLEHALNCAFSDHRGAGRPPDEPRTILTWERWSNIRQGGGDVDKLNRLAVSLVFVVLAVGFSAAGYMRLQSASEIPDAFAYVVLIASTLAGIASILWLVYLGGFAYSYRGMYNYIYPPEDSPSPCSLPDPADSAEHGQRHRAPGVAPTVTLGVCTGTESAQQTGR